MWREKTRRCGKGRCEDLQVVKASSHLNFFVYAASILTSSDSGSTLNERTSIGHTVTQMPQAMHEELLLSSLPCFSDWVGTWFSFNIEPTDGGSVLRFKNSGWAEASDFYAHCNCKWSFFLWVSLKNYLEQGKGSPAPEDPEF